MGEKTCFNCFGKGVSLIVSFTLQSTSSGKTPPPPCNNRIPRKSNEHNLYNTVLRGPLCSEKPHEPVLYDLTG